MSIPIDVYCVSVTRESAYVPMLFTGTTRYRPRYREDGSLDDALRERARGRTIIVHVHWEEFIVRECRTAAEADAAVATFARALAALRAHGTPIVWTVHNEVPHEVPHRRAFHALRALLADAADLILVHDPSAVAMLATQVAFDRKTVRTLAHPSYVGRFEDERRLHEELDIAHGRWIQGFGWIRRQKGFGAMIDALAPPFLAHHGLRIRISGTGDEAAAVMAECAARSDVVWDVRHVPDAEIPQLLRAAMCVVLPYERVVTSGVALVAMSVGAMLVAVDVPHIRNVLPPQSRRFLYPRGDAQALRDAIASVCALASDERRAIVRANIERACAIRPSSIAAELAAHYDTLVVRATSRHA